MDVGELVLVRLVFHLTALFDFVPIPVPETLDELRTPRVDQVHRLTFQLLDKQALDSLNSLLRIVRWRALALEPRLLNNIDQRHLALLLLGVPCRVWRYDERTPLHVVCNEWVELSAQECLDAHVL